MCHYDTITLFKANKLCHNDTPIIVNCLQSNYFQIIFENSAFYYDSFGFCKIYQAIIKIIVEFFRVKKFTLNFDFPERLEVLFRYLINCHVYPPFLKL